MPSPSAPPRRIRPFGRTAALLGCLLYLTAVTAQTTYYSQGNGTWETLSTWNSAPDGSGSQPTALPDHPNLRMVVQSNHTVTIQGVGSYSMAELQVDGALLANTNLPSTNKYLQIYGVSVSVSGALGAPNNTLSLEINGPNCVISGAGAIHLARLRKEHGSPGAATTTNLVIDADIALYWASSAALYYEGIGVTKKTFNVTINENRTVTTVSDVSIDGVDGTNSAWADGLFTVNGTLDVGRDLWITTDNPPNGNIAYQIGPLGKMIVRRQIKGNTGAGPSIAGLTIQQGGLLQLTGAISSVVCANLSASLNAFNFAGGATVEYAGPALQIVEDLLPYANLTISGGGQKNLEGLTTVQETLTLAGGILLHGAHDLIIGSAGGVAGGSTGAYCKTNAAGALRQTVGADPMNFPVGNQHFNPILANNAGTPAVLCVRVTDQVLSNGLSGLPITGFAVNRTWLIREMQPGTAGPITAVPQWLSAHELPGFNRNNCYVSFHDGYSWNQDAPGPASGSNPYTRTRAGVPLNTSGETPLALASQRVLPVELLFFDAQADGNAARLRWATAMERQNAYFAVERGAERLNFREIGRMAGAGYSDQMTAYTFTDLRPEPGLNYYRLRQVDFDGTETYSPARAVRFDQPKRLDQAVLFPSPASTILWVRAPDAPDAALCWDMLDSGL
ncbi:MAG: hypothetical protein ACR2K1_11910, partial [Saprospiraceae bacterium]